MLKRMAVVLSCLAGLCGPALAEDLTLVTLPAPQHEGKLSLEKVLSQRRSVRDYSPAPLSLSDLSQILWAAQGITAPGRRTAPSAGATYPLELYAVVQHVSNLPAGVYHFLPGTLPDTQQLEVVSTDDPAALLNIAIGQKTVAEGAVAVVFMALRERTARKYGELADRFVLLEAGHAAENLLLQAQALGLGAVPVGVFQSAVIQELVQSEAEPVYIVNLGKRN